MKFIEIILKIRNKINSFWISDENLNYLNQLRTLEAKNCHIYLKDNGNLLDFGSGTGVQAKVFSELQYKVHAIDVENSNYSTDHVFNIDFYDGLNIPFDENYFDIIFSSNVFEHIYDTKLILNELSRVTKDSGCMILLMPSSTWRIFTILTDIVKKWHIGKPHGEHSKNVLHEIFAFSCFWWKKQLFHKNWQLVETSKNRLFYTGNNIFGSKLSFKTRSILSKFLGSSCNIFILENKK